MISRIDVDTDGAIFEHAAFGIIDRGVTDTLDTVGDAGTDMFLRRLDTVLVNPTGHYRARIKLTTRRDDLVELHDSGVIYGPWLESGRAGTRFRGYSTFRKTAQDIHTRVDRFAARPVETMARRLER